MSEVIEKKGTSELKEVVMFVFSIIEAVSLSYDDDGKIGLNDVMNFYNTVTMIGPAVQGIGDVKAELLDLSAGERAELVQYVKTNFDISDDIKEGYFENGFQAALMLVELLKPIFAQKTFNALPAKT